MQQTEQTNPYTVYQPAYTPKPDTVYTKTMKEHFSFFGIGSLLYAIFYTFCLYKNASGITYPFFVAGTLFYFFFSMQKLGVPYKKSSIFYLVSIQLLGISNCLTDSPLLLFFNKCGISAGFYLNAAHRVHRSELGSSQIFYSLFPDSRYHDLLPVSPLWRHGVLF